MSVLGHAGEPLGGAAAQRRTLALLAVLAASGEGGMTRDKLVALLWPESDPERARHALTQALYAARRALGADDLFVVGNDVRLNGAVATSDVQQLDVALAADELERAVALYQGPFLDGFFFPGSTEFEQWSSAQRARIEERIVNALERLAAAAEAAADARQAVEWRRRVASIRPLDSGAAVKLMTALAAVGDRAGALQHARVHETLLREQLDLAPDSVVTSLARRLREPVDWEPPESMRTLPVPPDRESGDGAEAATPPLRVDDEAVQVDDASAVAAPRTAPREVAVLVARPAPASRRRALMAVLTAAAVLVATGVAIGRWSRPAPPDIRELPIRQRVVVAPFRVAGASASLAYLRDGMVELLSTRLADDTASRSVDAGAVLGAWRISGLAAATDVSRDTIVRLAQRLGAQRVVVGSVVGTPERLILRATALAVPSGAVRGEAAVQGSADSLATLVDRLAARLLLSQAGEDDDLAMRTTESLPALRAYLAGQAALRRGAPNTAMRQFELALERDSGFALAALQLAAAADEARDVARLRQGIARAWPLRDAMADRERALLDALAGPRYPQPSPGRELVPAWRHVVDLAPTSAEAWYELGRRLYFDGAAAGVPAADSAARSALERARALDPNHVPTAQLLLDLAAHASGGDADEPRALAGVALRDTANPSADYVRWRLARAEGDSAALARLRDSLFATPFGPLRLIALAALADGHLDDADRALGELRRRDGSAAERLEVTLGDHAFATVRGRPREALAVASRLPGAQPGTHAQLRMRVLDALYGEGDSAVAAAAARSLASLTDGDGATAVTPSDTRAADLCTVAQWRLARGDTSGVARAIAKLRTASPPRRHIAVATPPAVCAALLDAARAVALRRPDAGARVIGLDSLALTLQTAGDATTYTPVAIARLHERLGDRRRALAAVRDRARTGSWPRYLATALALEGRLAEALGDAGIAQAAYERYLRLRTDAEDALVPRVDSLRRRISARTAGPTD